MHALNTSEHSATDQTPYRTHYGYNMATCGNEYKMVDVNGEPSLHRDRLANIRAEMVRHLYKADPRMRKQYDKKTRPVEYGVGERVWRRNFKLSKKINKYTAKLGPLYVPCIVLRRVGTVAYDLQDEGGETVGIYPNIPRQGKC